MDDKDLLFNLERLYALAGDDEGFVRQMALMFNKQTPPLLKDLREYYQAQNWEKVKAVAHKIKPSLDFMGIEEIKPEIRMIEDYSINRTNLDDLPDLIDRLEEICELVFEQVRNKFP